MEWNIGEIKQVKGEWYQCVESQDGSCKHCDMNFEGKCPIPIKECTESGRSDKSYVIFKKLEKVGEPFIGKVHIKLQRYKIYTEPIIDPAENVGYVNEENTIAIEIKQNKEDMEENKLNLKPFDIQKAREGKPVCTRDGRKARIICFDLKNDEYPIVAAVENDSSETLFSYTTNGEIADGIESDKDLMMLLEKKEGWVNVYKDSVYDTKDEALIGRSESRGYIDTIKINWSE